MFTHENFLPTFDTSLEKYLEQVGHCFILNLKAVVPVIANKNNSECEFSQSNGVKFENYIFYEAGPPKMEKSISILSLKIIKFV